MSVEMINAPSNQNDYFSIIRLHTPFVIMGILLAMDLSMPAKNMNLLIGSHILINALILSTAMFPEIKKIFSVISEKAVMRNYQ